MLQHIFETTVIKHFIFITGKYVLIATEIICLVILKFDYHFCVKINSKKLFYI